MSEHCDVVIVNCFDTYEHRVTLLKRYFGALGKCVRVITSDWRHIHKESRHECPEGFEMLHVKPYTKNLSPQRLMSHYYFAKDAIARVEELRPDLLWVLVPPNSLVRCAAAYKNRHPEIKLVLDFIDMWPETMPISHFKDLPPFSNWRALRDKYLYNADTIVTECALYHEILSRTHCVNKLQTLYLARDPGEFHLKLNLPRDRIALCYLGSINNIIDIPRIGEIIEAIDAPVDLHIIGDGEKRQELIDTAETAGAAVTYHGKVYDPEEKRRILDCCHFGLNIMKDSVFVGLTMKSMDYFEYGLPIINNIRGDTWNFVEQNNIGINLDALKRTNAVSLCETAQHRAEVRDFFERHFTYTAFCKKMDEISSSL